MPNEYGQRAVDAVNAGRQEVANTIEHAADRFEDKVRTIPGGEAVSGIARDTAEKVKSAAQYVRDHDVKDMAGDMTTLVKAHPIPAILGAAVIGFLAGRAARHS